MRDLESGCISLGFLLHPCGYLHPRDIGGVRAMICSFMVHWHGKDWVKLCGLS